MDTLIWFKILLMHLFKITVYLFTLLTFSYSNTFAGVIKNYKKRKVYVVSIGFNGNNWKPEKEIENLGYPNCPVCISDVTVFSKYFLSFNKSAADTTISYAYPNSISLDSLYGLFYMLEKKITSKDIFVFYYSSGSWGLANNPVSGKQESYYILSNQLTNKSNIYQHSFTLQALKQLTDKLAAKNQLMVFDTGLGNVIQNDFTNNFFSNNINEANFTRKNRIIICPEKYSGETEDTRDSLRKGDLVRILTSIPTAYNILNLFSDSGYQNTTNKSNYKNMMEYFWKEQKCCLATLKIIRESESISYLTAFQNQFKNNKRSTLKPTEEQVKTDSSIKSRKLKAIIIATNTYQAPNTWANLETPIDDALSIASILHKQYKYDTTLLLNPTKEQILRVFDNITIQESVNPYSQYIVYFAGHGLWVNKRGGYIVTNNSKEISNISMPLSEELATYLSYSDLFNSLGLLNKVVLITDVCFGGTSFNSIISRNAEITPANETTVKRNPYKKILASGIKEVDDFVRLHDGTVSKHSPFAQCLIDILNDKNTTLSFEKLFALLKEKQKEPTPVSKDFGEITEPNLFNL